MGKRPTVGQVVMVYGVRCRIVRVRPFGTIDVVEVGGNRAWRLTGLDFGEVL